VADDDERPSIYTPKAVRAGMRKMRDWEDAGITRIVAEDVRIAQEALEKASRLTGLEQVVLSDRLYLGYSEERVARKYERDCRTVRRAVSSASRKIAIWLNSPSHGMEKGYRRLLAKIFGA
jgi:hypothetical protein